MGMAENSSKFLSHHQSKQKPLTSGIVAALVSGR